jgi:exopolyphosphatase/guanosine-5'-triphosphate,3'-diphosphate pyrophosphatase
VGIRDGILAELSDRLAGREDPSGAERALLRDAERVGEHYRYDSAHAAKVREHAFILFDALRPLHRLGERERRLLGVAATLHDVGELVGYAHHHKHSYYLVSNAEIGGISAEDLRVAAVVVRYHRRAHPSDRHEEYATLSREDRKRVSRLAAILRVADALDREHRQRVVELRASLTRRRLELRVRARGELALERWAIESKSSLFREVFGHEVALRVDADPPAPASPTAKTGAKR